MNNDLISRESLKKHITEIFETEEKIDKKWAMGLKYSLKIIDSAPTVDTTFNEVVAYECGQKSVERPQGEWKFDGWGTYCSECGYRPKLGGGKFCSECGADMRVKDELNHELNELGGNNESLL